MRMCAFWKSAKPQYSLRLTVTAVAVLSGMLGTSSTMAVNLADNVQVHGFASQDYIKTSANNFFGSSDSGSFDFRELGANLSWQARPDLQFAIQVNSRKAGATDEDKTRVDYALLDYTYYVGSTERAGVRLGRNKNPIGFYNLTRDVANTRPSIFLPESIYRDDARNLILSLDGAQLYGELRSSAGDFILDFGAGKPILDSKSMPNYKGNQSYVGRLLYERDGGRLRLALTDVDAEVASTVSSAKANLKTYILSAQYNAEQWGITTEFQPEQKTISSGNTGTFAALQNTTTVSSSYYMQGTYQIAQNWEALLRYDVLYADKSDKSGEKMAADSAAAYAYYHNFLGLPFPLPVPAYSRFAKDLTVGIGWKAMPALMLRAELHHVNGTAWLSSKENPVAMSTKEQWNMFALQASYSF